MSPSHTEIFRNVGMENCTRIVLLLATAIAFTFVMVFRKCCRVVCMIRGSGMNLPQILLLTKMLLPSQEFQRAGFKVSEVDAHKWLAINDHYLTRRLRRLYTVNVMIEVNDKFLQIQCLEVQ